MKGRLSACSMESEPDIVKDDVNPLAKQVHTEASSIDNVTQRQDSFRKWPDRSLCAGNNGNLDIISSEYIERLVPLTSKGNNLRVPDDEMVDLTEPRFESFCIVNVKSSS